MSHARRRSAKLDRRVGVAIVLLGLLTYGATLTISTSRLTWMLGWSGASILLVGGWVLHSQGRIKQRRLNRGER